MEEISFVQDGSSVEVISEKGAIQLQSSADPDNLANTSDFAVWLYLPVAMKSGEDLFVDGMGTNKTAENARKISNIWASWVPEHFSSVNVEFTNTVNFDSTKSLNNNRDLILFSGGIDSTFSASQRAKSGHIQDFLTFQGMDYGVNDDEKFQKLLDKTEPFISELGGERITLKSNASKLYTNIGVNLEGHHISHIFNLTGGLFLHSGYENYFIASDYPHYQQYIVHPYGSNSVTNQLFSDGTRQLYTLDDSTERTEKLEALVKNEFISTTSFCKDYSIRPENCGVCSKCVRTKIMFLAQAGKIPDVFEDNSVPTDWYKIMNPKKPNNRAPLSEIVKKGKMNQTGNNIPNFEEAMAHLENISEHAQKSQSTHGFKREIYSLLPHPIDQLAKRTYYKLF